MENRSLVGSERLDKPPHGRKSLARALDLGRGAKRREVVLNIDGE